jgi:hypothetical protein
VDRRLYTYQPQEAGTILQPNGVKGCWKVPRAHRLAFYNPEEVEPFQGHVPIWGSEEIALI